MSSAPTRPRTPFSRGDAPRTLVELVAFRSHTDPAQRIYTFLLDGETRKAHLDAAELEVRTRAVAALLQQRARPRDRALLLYPPGLDYVVAFLACAFAGVVPVPAYPPLPGFPLGTLESIAHRAECRLVLAPRALLKPLRSRLANIAALEHARYVATDNCDLAAADAWKDPGICSNDLAMLQFTSGSTSKPRGVMLTHAHLLANSALIYDCLGTGPQGHGVIWLPPYHDMGLIGGILQPLYAGMAVTLMSPLHFLQQPVRWLSAISRTRATTSAAPNFAYDLCVRKTTPEQRDSLDLSHWAIALLGGEKVRARTLDAFSDAFEPAGFRREAFYPSYGLAEATLIASGGRRSAGPIVRAFDADELSRGRAARPRDSGAARRLVGCGGSLPGQRLRIVDSATRMSLPERRVGEIWLSGPSVATGYWNEAIETSRAFAACTADTGEGPFLATGDLGFLDGEELFVTGRSRDLVVVHGRNHHPEDLEATVEGAHARMRRGCVAVFAVEGEDAERVAVAAELTGAAGDSPAAALLEEVTQAIRRAIRRAHGIVVDEVVLTSAGALPKTTSGKIQRGRCREAFRSGHLSRITTKASPVRRPAP